MAHPAFDRLPPERQFRGKRLEALFLALQREAKANRPSPEQLEEDKGWSWKMLPRGAVVALRHRPDLYDRLELRLARMDEPKDPKGWAAWNREVQVFLRKFGIRPLDGDTPCRHVHRDWFRVREEPRDEGKAAARFMELREGEISPGRARCHRCFEQDGTFVELEWMPVYGVRNQLCGACRLPAATREGGFLAIVCTRGKGLKGGGCRTVRLGAALSELVGAIALTLVITLTLMALAILFNL